MHPGQRPGRNKYKNIDMLICKYINTTIPGYMDACICLTPRKLNSICKLKSVAKLNRP